MTMATPAQPIRLDGRDYPVPQLAADELVALRPLLGALAAAPTLPIVRQVALLATVAVAVLGKDGALPSFIGLGERMTPADAEEIVRLVGLIGQQATTLGPPAGRA